MKRILGGIRRADERFGLIKPGDSIAIGLSGGKDSLSLVRALSLYRLFSKCDYKLCAISIDLGFGADFTALQQYCQQQDVPLTVIKTDIGPVVFDERKEKNPCSLCAKMRRGALNGAARDLGCNKVALGHNREDVLETLLLSWIYEGRLHTFQPSTYLSRQDVTVIRPLVLVPEKELARKARQDEMPVLDSGCPANGKTKREDMKQLLLQFHHMSPGAVDRMMSALMNTDQYGLWDQ